MDAKERKLTITASLFLGRIVRITRQRLAVLGRTRGVIEERNGLLYLKLTGRRLTAAEVAAVGGLHRDRLLRKRAGRYELSRDALRLLLHLGEAGLVRRFGV